MSLLISLAVIWSAIFGADAVYVSPDGACVSAVQEVAGNDVEFVAVYYAGIDEDRVPGAGRAVSVLGTDEYGRAVWVQLLSVDAVDSGLVAVYRGAGIRC